jgi:hypothetical protein
VTWPALIEIWTSEVLGFIPNLPGLQVSGESVESVITRLDGAVDPYVAWLRDGELVSEAFSVQPVLLDQVEEARESKGPVFQHDQIAPDDDQVELALGVGRAAVSDLLFVRDDLTADSLIEADRILRHVAGMDRWYATRMLAANGTAFTSIEDELVQSASLFEETIDLVQSGRRVELWTVDGEDWTLAKVLRRRTGHLREHLPEIMALLD